MTDAGRLEAYWNAVSHTELWDLSHEGLASQDTFESEALEDYTEADYQADRSLIREYEARTSEAERQRLMRGKKERATKVSSNARPHEEVANEASRAAYSPAGAEAPEARHDPPLVGGASRR